MKIYVIVEKNKDKKEEHLIAIFMNKNLAECYLDDTPLTENWKIIELKGK